MSAVSLEARARPSPLIAGSIVVPRAKPGDVNAIRAAFFIRPGLVLVITSAEVGVTGSVGGGAEVRLVIGDRRQGGEVSRETVAIDANGRGTANFQLSNGIAIAAGQSLCVTAVNGTATFFGGTAHGFLVANQYRVFLDLLEHEDQEKRYFVDIVQPSAITAGAYPVDIGEPRSPAETTMTIPAWRRTGSAVSGHLRTRWDRGIADPPRLRLDVGRRTPTRNSAAQFTVLPALIALVRGSPVQGEAATLGHQCCVRPGTSAIRAVNVALSSS